MVHHHTIRHDDDHRSKRRQILDAAHTVFSHKGYHRATVDEIVALADTGKGTVYNYFSNKEQLFYTLIQERSQPFEDSLRRAAASGQPPLAKIEAVVTLALRFYKDNAALWRVMMHEVRDSASAGRSHITSDNKDKFREAFRRIISLFEGILREGIEQGALRNIDVTRAAYSLFSIVVMLVYHDFVDEDMDVTARKVTDVFLNGAACRDDRPGSFGA